jgi:hypothetical protein
MAHLVRTFYMDFIAILNYQQVQDIPIRLDPHVSWCESALIPIIMLGQLPQGLRGVGRMPI